MNYEHGEYVVDGIRVTQDEGKLVLEYKGFDLTGDDIVKIFRLGVAKGREIEASLAPQSVCHDN